MDDGKLTGTDNILSRLFFHAAVRLPTLSQVSNDRVCPNHKFGSYICMNHQIFGEKPSETFAIAPTSFIAIRKSRWPRFVRIGFMTETSRLRHNDGVGESRGFMRRNIFRPAPKICHDTGYGKQLGLLEHQSSPTLDGVGLGWSDSSQPLAALDAYEGRRPSYQNPQIQVCFLFSLM
jgi:hypothetical protein